MSTRRGDRNRERKRKTERSVPINIHRETLGNTVERSLVVSRGKSNRSRRLQTRAAELQTCMPGCIRVGVTQAALNPNYANICCNHGEKCLSGSEIEFVNRRYSRFFTSRKTTVNLTFFKLSLPLSNTDIKLVVVKLLVFLIELYHFLNR